MRLLWIIHLLGLYDKEYILFKLTQQGVVLFIAFWYFYPTLEQYRDQASNHRSLMHVRTLDSSVRCIYYKESGMHQKQRTIQY